MAQINLVRVKSDHTVPQRSQKDDRFGHRGKFIWKIECLLERMDSETVGSHWPGTSALFTMLSFIRDDDVTHAYTPTETHLTSFGFFFSVPRVCTNAIYLHDSIGFLVIICRMKRARNFPGITRTNTEKKVCSLWHWLGHLLADPQRKRKPPTSWQSKNEKKKWKAAVIFVFLPQRSVYFHSFCFPPWLIIPPQYLVNVLDGWSIIDLPIGLHEEIYRLMLSCCFT